MTQRNQKKKLLECREQEKKLLNSERGRDAHKQNTNGFFSHYNQELLSLD
jgi:hypothetical protein